MVTIYYTAIIIIIIIITLTIIINISCIVNDLEINSRKLEFILFNNFDSEFNHKLGYTN